MVQINRKAWLIFDLVGLVFVIAGTIGYIGLFIEVGADAALPIFFIGLFFVVIGAIFGHLEGMTLKEQVADMLRDRNVAEAAAAVPDDSDVPYILDMDAAWNQPLPDQVDMDELFEKPEKGDRKSVV